jgi:SAM-dependent methyltransferase
MLRADHVIAAHRPIPAGAGLERFAVPGAGVVLGFRRGNRGPPPDEPYADFQDLFRGDSELVRTRQREYLPLLGEGPLLDLGCGRGEMLDLAREAGVPATGVDSDRSMAQRAIDRGHAVVVGDLVDALAATRSSSLGTIFCAQVVEHLSADALWKVLALSADRLRPDGRLIVETVNPYHPVWLRLFWIDPTHRAPVHPELLLSLCRIAGFGAAWSFHPGGTGHVDVDQISAPDYALVAERRPRDEDP